jgi:radical SAM protein with 4Fe4S-binding SPASM domain
MTEGKITQNSFCWVDDYINNVRPHFDIRDDDHLLIVLPNRAVKLNPTGLQVLQHLKKGGTIRDILDPLAGDETRVHELYYFLCDFKSLISGCLGEGFGRKAVRVESHARQPFNLLPILSEVALTYRCNLRCKFCYAGCNCRGSDQPADLEMSTDEVVNVFRIIRQVAKVPSVSFTGGEPLLRTDILRLTAEAVQIGLRVNLITNATLLAGTDLATNLARAGLTSAQVSLEGPTAKIHDEITDQPGSFDKSLAGLSLLREAGIHVHTNTTINTANVDHLLDLVELIEKLKLKRMSMNLIIPAGTARGRELQIPYHRIGPIVEQVRLAARKRNLEFMWYSPTPMCLFNPIAAGLGNKSCAACDGLLSVSPAGDVLPCSSYPEPVGNLLTEPFEQIWNNARAKFLRSKSYAPAQCSGCEDFTACAGACPLYWSAMGTQELTAIGRTCHAAS